MTPEAWSTCTDPTEMLSYLRDRAVGARKLRLFAVACGRRVELWMPDERSPRALGVSEAFADGGATRRALEAARRAAYDAFREAEGVPAAAHAAVVALNAAMPRRGWDDVPLAVATAKSASGLFALVLGGASESQERHAQADLLRCVLGNPFETAAFDPSWRTSTATSLAAGMYKTRDFLLMPILGDALADAGCPDGHILEHCRGPGSHVRGCFVVDLVLDRS